MIGNVWELCPKPDSKGQQSILRGGSCQDVHPDSLTSSKRGFQSVDKFHSNIGFRVVLELAPSELVAASGRAATTPPAGGPAVPSSASVATATKDAPFVNSLGIKFVPVPITGGPTDGKRVLFSIWETRERDYEVFVRETGCAWQKAADIDHGPDHPATNASWEDATAFCAWLTERERKVGKLGTQEVYRLPTDHEWSCAVGIGEKEDAAKVPAEKSQEIADIYPWGTSWPPPEKTGNYWSEELRALQASGKHSHNWNAGEIPGYRDGFATTAPVGSYAANRSGLHDLDGNVWEWCGDRYQNAETSRVLRGGSFYTSAPKSMVSSYRGGLPPSSRTFLNGGFRIVLAPVADGGAAAPAAAVTGMKGASSANAVLAGASALSVKPGRLRGSGFHLDGKPLDLKKAEGITDFVQVILTDRGWVGLRATGDQVTPEEGWGEKNIARLLPAWFNSYGTINREGRLSIRRETSEGVKAIPDEVQRIGVVDACWDGGQAIALVKDGSARVWGEHYTTGYQAQPVWPAPPAEALQNVRKIAITHWRAATLRHDGKWHIWGGHGDSSGPFDLADFQQWGEIADIATTYEPFRVLARDGKLYNLGGSRPLSGGIVTEGVAAIYDHLVKRQGAALWSWLDPSRANAQPEVDALLKQIGDRPREAFDIRIVGDRNASNVAAVWIEPVE